MSDKRIVVSPGSCRPVLLVVSLICDWMITDAVSKSDRGVVTHQMSIRSGLGAETVHWSLRSGLGEVTTQTLESASLFVFSSSLSFSSSKVPPFVLIVDIFV